MKYYLIFVIGLIGMYLGLIAFTDFSINHLIRDGSIDCSYYTEKGILRNCIEFD